jgi:secreted trypsin-like serine protease
MTGPPAFDRLVTGRHANSRISSCGLGENVPLRFYLAMLIVLLLLSLLGVVPARAATDLQGEPVFLPFVGQSAPAQQSVNSAIVGGQDADPGEWPWQVLVIIANTYMCGGSIVHPQWVVTAGHCVLAEAVPLRYFPPSSIVVVAGEHNLGAWDATEQALGVAEMVPHPDYDPFTSDSDLALLKLSEPVTLNSAVAAVPLVTSPVDDALAVPGNLATATGWGATSTYGSAAAILQEVSVPIISNSTCNQAFNGAITANMICAGYDTGGKDTCYGDSGGPLVVPDGAGGWKLAGITSFGPRECATKYGGYTRVSRFASWIGAQIEPAEITGFSPLSGPVNSQVTITGKSFVGVSDVRFGDVPAQFSVASAAELVATVPPNAVSGPIRVATAFGDAVSAQPFTLEYPLAVTVTGPGTGRVRSNLGNINCGPGEECSENYVDGSLVELNAQDGPDTEYVFAGWLGDCSGAAQTCSVLMDTSRVVTAVFSLLTPTLTVAVSAVDGGAGSVRSEPAGIDCGERCAAGYAVNSSVSLAAQPVAGSVFSGWGGACAGAGTTCQVTMLGAQSVSALFQPDTYTLTVSLDGEGGGRVTSFPAGIDCGGACSSAFATGSTVNLTAQVEAGYGLAAWGGACSGAGRTCAVTIDSVKSVTATFEKRGVYLPAVLWQGATTQ